MGAAGQFAQSASVAHAPQVPPPLLEPLELPLPEPLLPPDDPPLLDPELLALPELEPLSVPASLPPPPRVLDAPEHAASHVPMHRVQAAALT
jgi:hypothetical protein